MMTELSKIIVRGVSPTWSKRSALVKALRKINVRSTKKIIDYNQRLDSDNSVNLVPSVYYGGLGRDLQFEAIALALEGKEWTPSLAQPLAYRLLANKLDYFWHENFLVLYRENGRTLNMYNADLAIIDMAFAFLIGWNEEAVHQGYITHAALNRKHYILWQYEYEHRRGQAFMMRLFSNWQGIVEHKWPDYAYDEPIYNGLLERWRDPDPESLVPWLIAACDLHTHETKRESSNNYYDFSDYTLVRTPIEILMLFRLRELIGLQNPQLSHPLLAFPFDTLPDFQERYQPDDLMSGTLHRVRQDWPMFDQIISSEALKARE